MRNRKKKPVLLYSLIGLVGLGIVAVLLYQLPSVQYRLGWRLEIAKAYARGLMQPVQPIPTAFEVTEVSPQAMEVPTQTPTLFIPTTTLQPAINPPTPTPAPTSLPAQVILPSPAYEKQDWNNCGPATLALYLRYYGWKGDQFSISDLVKPVREDKNVNVDELLYYVYNRAGWLEAMFRVGGSVDLIRKLVAAGIPVMVEASTFLAEPNWPNDDRWAGHFLMVTGYDNARQVFITQDTYVSADRLFSYSEFDSNWQPFNRLFILIFTPDEKAVVQSILGVDWNEESNRQHALETAQVETQADGKNAFAWFNLGSNQVYFERYLEAGRAYDTARKLGLPQRMLRYQFGPFLTYFHSLRTDDLLAVTDYALKITPDSEEAALWRGWALYRKGDKPGAIEMFTKALKLHPKYKDAEYALNYVKNN